jgi:hypothetical protein
MMAEISDLSKKQLIQATQVVVGAWAEDRGVEVLVVWQALENASKDRPLEPWLLKPTENEAKAAEACKKILLALFDCDDAKVRRWCRDAVAAAAQAKAQVFDPFTIAIIGTVVFGLVLAVGVKKVSKEGVDFYEGLPKDTDKVIKAGVAAATGIPSQ